MKKPLSALLLVATAATFSAFAAPADQTPPPQTAQGQEADQQALPGVKAAEELSAFARWSDARLKSDVAQVGTTPLGIGVYEYEIFGKRELGVMAQELEKVLPEAVVTTESGYKMVRYDLIPGWDKIVAAHEAAASQKGGFHKAAYARWSDERLKSKILRVGSM